MATLRKHALSCTQGFHCIVVFFFYLWFIEQNYRTECSFFCFFVCFHICEHLFSYSNVYSVVMSSACSFLALMKLIGDSCLTKKSVWQRVLLNPEPLTSTAYSDIHVQKISEGTWETCRLMKVARSQIIMYPLGVAVETQLIDSLHRKNTSFNPPFNQTIKSTSFQVNYTRATLTFIDLST